MSTRQRGDRGFKWPSPCGLAGRLGAARVHARRLDSRLGRVQVARSWPRLACTRAAQRDARDQQSSAVHPRRLQPRKQAAQDIAIRTRSAYYMKAEGHCCVRRDKIDKCRGVAPDSLRPCAKKLTSEYCQQSCILRLLPTGHSRDVHMDTYACSVTCTIRRYIRRWKATEKGRCFATASGCGAVWYLPLRVGHAVIAEREPCGSS